MRPTQNVHASRGIGTVVRNLVREVGLRDDLSYHFFLVGSDSDLPYLSAHQRRIHCYRFSRFHQFNWIVNQLLVPRLLKHHAVDVFFATDFQSYIIPPQGIKQVAIAYDLIPFLFPETMAGLPRLARLGLRVNFRNLCCSHRIVSISEATKRDLTRLLGIPPEKILVVYLGLDHTLFNLENAAKPMNNRYGAIGDYFLYVGDPEWQKNLRGVLEAFSGILDHVKLVIAGKLAPHDIKLKQWLVETNTLNRVVLPGYVPDDDLPCLYGHAVGFVLTSRYEGFGLPVAEAMVCGCPVITSHNSSLPEVAGNAAIYIDPEQSEDVREAMISLLQDAGKRNVLRNIGLVQVKRFTWDKFGREVQAALSEAYSNAPA